jgi:hypothetical protein
VVNDRVTVVATGTRSGRLRRRGQQEAGVGVTLLERVAVTAGAERRRTGRGTTAVERVRRGVGAGSLTGTRVVVAALGLAGAKIQTMRSMTWQSITRVRRKMTRGGGRICLHERGASHGPCCRQLSREPHRQEPELRGP